MYKELENLCNLRNSGKNSPIIKQAKDVTDTSLKKTYGWQIST
jgi:hypothetical protein